MLRVAKDSLVYECLLKSTEEYKNIKEDDKIKKEPRTFLYILFQIVQVAVLSFPRHLYMKWQLICCHVESMEMMIK